MKKYILAFFVLISVNIFAQDFEAIDKKAKRLNYFKTLSPRSINRFLTSKYETQEEKLRAIYAWIGQNIKYDVKHFGFQTTKPPKFNKILLKRKAKSQEIVLLFKELCKYAGINTYEIKGYDKSSWHFKHNEKYIYDEGEWIIVELDGKYCLVDIVPACGFIKSNTSNFRILLYRITNGYVSFVRNKFQREYSDDYFLMDEKSRIYFKMPANPTWQLMENTVSLSAFENDSIYRRNLKVTTDFSAQNNLVHQSLVNYYLSEAYQSFLFNNKNNHIRLYYYCLAHTELTYKKKTFDLPQAIDFVENILISAPLYKNDILQKEREYLTKINTKYSAADVYMNKRFSFINNRLRVSKRAIKQYKIQIKAIEKQYLVKKNKINNQKNTDISNVKKPEKLKLKNDTTQVSDIKKKLNANLILIKDLETKESLLIDSIQMIQTKIAVNSDILFELYAKFNETFKETLLGDFLGYDLGGIVTLDTNSTKLINKIKYQIAEINQLENVQMISLLNKKQSFASQFISIHQQNQAFLKQLKAVSVNDHDENQKFRKELKLKIKNQEKHLEKLLYHSNFKKKKLQYHIVETKILKQLLKNVKNEASKEKDCFMYEHNIVSHEAAFNTKSTLKLIKYYKRLLGYYNKLKKLRKG